MLLSEFLGFPQILEEVLGPQQTLLESWQRARCQVPMFTKISLEAD